MKYVKITKLLKKFQKERKQFHGNSRAEQNLRQIRELEEGSKWSVVNNHNHNQECTDNKINSIVQ